MRTCKNCVFSTRVKKAEWCMKHGTLCRIAVGGPDRESCGDHQFPEKVIKPLLDESVNLLDSFLVTLSAGYERRAKDVISKRDEFFS